MIAQANERNVTLYDHLVGLRREVLPLDALSNVLIRVVLALRELLEHLNEPLRSIAPVSILG
jgi:hypothetical protein